MLYNDPKTFREDMLKGYVAAYPDYVVEVPGGVARATKMAEGKIAVINGGGSGHYPAFCGIIGDGFMDATVVGNVFTSPSTEDVLGVAHSVDQGTGIFIVGGNYAGDKMNFNMARDRLVEEGVDCRTFYITDDVASAKPEEIEKRRGNVGTFMVFKAAGAAAAAGVSFDELVRITEKANDRTRTMSMGFRGCTLPGGDEPLFHVPQGKMEVGQGIHGEPGVGEADLASAPPRSPSFSSSACSPRRPPTTPSALPSFSTVWAPPSTRSSSSCGAPSASCSRTRATRSSSRSWVST